MQPETIKLTPCTYVAKSGVPCRNNTRHESGRCIFHHRGKTPRVHTFCLDCGDATYSITGMCAMHRKKVTQQDYRVRKDFNARDLPKDVENLV